MRWWEWLPRVNRTCVDAPAFAWLNTVLFHILCPAISIRDPMAASRAAAADWARLLQGKSVMRFSAFFVRLWPAAPSPSHHSPTHEHRSKGGIAHDFLPEDIPLACETGYCARISMPGNQARFLRVHNASIRILCIHSFTSRS